jgi:hypothetical protein
MFKMNDYNNLKQSKMNTYFSNNRLISIFIFLMLMIFIQCTSFSQDKSGAAKSHHEVKTMTDGQTTQIKTILSGYNPSTLTAEQAKEIHEKFREAGIHPGPDTKDAIIAAGFDPEKLRTLAPPPGKDNKAGNEPPSLEERMKLVDEKIVKPLSLNNSQNGTVTSAFSEFFREMDKLRQSQENNNGPLKKSKIDPLERSRDEKIKQVLTTEQFIKYQELEKSARPPKPGTEEKIK